jgi:hypothetical protein
MKNPNQRLQFLNNYRTQLRHELSQMGYRRPSEIALEETTTGPDRMTSFITIAAMLLVFASVFIVQ